MAFANAIILWTAAVVFVFLFLFSYEKRKLLMMQPRSPRAWQLFLGALLCFVIFHYGASLLVMNPLPENTPNYSFGIGVSIIGAYESLTAPLLEEAGRLGILLPLSQISVSLGGLISSLIFVLAHGDHHALTHGNPVGAYFVWIAMSFFFTFVSLRFGFLCAVLAHMAANVVSLGGIIYLPAPFTFLNWLLPLTFLTLAFILVSKQKDSILNYDCGLLTFPADRREPEHEVAAND